jgi:hypothetical protein
MTSNTAERFTFPQRGQRLPRDKVRGANSHHTPNGATSALPLAAKPLNVLPTNWLAHNRLMRFVSGTLLPDTHAEARSVLPTRYREQYVVKHGSNADRPIDITLIYISRYLKVDASPADLQL